MKSRTDILFVPHPYDARWSKDLNRLLAPTFFSPLVPKENKYMASRSLFHQLTAKLLIESRRQQVSGVFFCDLTFDFSPDFLHAGGARDVWGFVHGTHMGEARMADEGIVKQDHLHARLERGIYGYAKRIFVASGVMAENLGGEFPVDVVGLPLFGPPTKPTLSPRLLWNHRLSPEKRYKKLAELPDDLRDRTVVSTPMGGPQVVPEVREAVRDVYYKPTHETYVKIRRSSGYALNFSYIDYFGYSTMESVWDGLFALAPSRKFGKHVASSEFLPAEMIYDEFGEVEERIRYYDAHPEERTAVVLKAQKQLSYLRSSLWLENLLGKVVG